MLALFPEESGWVVSFVVVVVLLLVIMGIWRQRPGWDQVAVSNSLLAYWAV